MNTLVITGLLILFACGPGNMASKVAVQPPPNPISLLMNL